MGVRSTFTAYETKGDFTGAQNIEACGLKLACTGVKGKISPSGRFVEGNCFNLSTFFFLTGCHYCFGLSPGLDLIFGYGRIKVMKRSPSILKDIGVI